MLYEFKGTGDILQPSDERDYKAEEVFRGEVSVKWEKKPVKAWKRLPILDQGSTSACGGFTIAKILGNENLLETGRYTELSPRDIYSRAHLPDGGVYARTAMAVGKKYGATVHQLMPTFTEDGMDVIEEEDMRRRADETDFTNNIAELTRGGAYAQVPVDIDEMAKMIARGKAIAISTRFEDGGFTPEVKLTKRGKHGHLVAGVDFGIWEGKKAIIFDNSWGYDWGVKLGEDFTGQGILTEDQLHGVPYVWFFENRPNTLDTFPAHHFSRDLKYGEESEEVVALQNILKYLGKFPETVRSTGYYGDTTARGVYSYQVEYAVAPMEELDELQGESVGPKTRAMLNKQFSV